MRIIKIFLAGLIGLFVFVTLFSLVIPSNIRVSRATIIHSSKDEVYKQVTDLKNWKNWHPLFKNNVIKILFSNPSKGINAYCDLNYKNKQTHLQVTGIDTSSIQFLLQLKGENDISNQISITPLTEQNAVQVEWQALTKMHWYPWEKFYGIFIDKIYGPGYEDALNGLKEYAESR